LAGGREPADNKQKKQKKKKKENKKKKKKDHRVGEETASPVSFGGGQSTSRRANMCFQCTEATTGERKVGAPTRVAI